MNKKIVLVYEMETGKRRQLKAVMSPLGISVREVLPSQYASTIGELALGKKQNGMPSANIPYGSGPVIATQTIGEMIVFSGVASDEMDSVLNALKQAELQIPLKATVTMYNVSWTGYALYKELAREHKQMQK